MDWIRTTHLQAPPKGEAHLWQADYLNWADRLVELKSHLSSEEVDRSDRFLREGDRKRYVFAHGLLRRVLATCCRCEPAVVGFGCGGHGKPYLAHPSVEGEVIEFNISHSGDIVLIGVAQGCPLGVDVERLSRKVEFKGLSERYFSLEEAETIQRLPQGQGSRTFFETWVCKEAFIKAVGEGLTMPLNSFSVHLEDGRTTVGPSAEKENLSLETPWFLDRFEVASDYVGAVAMPVEKVRLTGFLLQ